MNTLAHPNLKEMSLPELEEALALISARKAELQNTAALEHRTKLKTNIAEMFDNFRDQVLHNCGSSIEMLEEVSEKLKTFKLSSFFSGSAKENIKPLNGVMTEEGMQDISNIILNKISYDNDWARRVTHNGSYIIFRQHTPYWMGRGGSNITPIINITDDKLVIHQKGRDPHLKTLPFDVVNFLNDFFTRPGK